MEENKKNKKIVNKIFSRILITLLVAFTALYISGETGYYEYELHKQVTLTNEKIKEFEEDVKNGKNINIKDYLIESEIDYSNKISKTGLSISESIGNIIQSGIETAFNFLNKFMEE